MTGEHHVSGRRASVARRWQRNRGEVRRTRTAALAHDLGRPKQPSATAVETLADARRAPGAAPAQSPGLRVPLHLSHNPLTRRPGME